jgi:DNA-binding CsgD family transcriptional regulator
MSLKDKQRLPEEVVLSSLFKLTPAEARIAIGIARGEPLADIAGSHGITVQTARTQLKSVFSKTHTNRQAQLAILLMEVASSST